MSVAYAETLPDPYMSPILTLRQVAALTDAKESTVKSWAHSPSPVMHTVKTPRTWPSVPFVGLVEAEILSELSAMTSPMKALSVVRGMRKLYGEDFAMENTGLVTDLTHTFIQEGTSLTRVGDNQTAIFEVLKDHLRSLHFGADGRVSYFSPTLMPFASIHPEFNGGQLSITDSRVPVSAIVGLLSAGDHRVTVAREYDVDEAMVAYIEEHLEWAKLAA